MVTHYIHRGLAKKHFKENTLTSFKYCFKKKYGVETDLHCTKDNKIICFHDFTLKRKFKINKKIKDSNYSYLKEISTKNKAEIPLLSHLLKASKKKFPLLLELKPFFSLKNLKKLLFETKKYKKCALISFKEKNIYNLGKLKTKLSLGLLFSSTTKIETIILKSKKSYIDFIVLHKTFLKNKNLSTISKPIYYYPIPNKKEFTKYRRVKNLIFENL
jgi:glycerophosphoryl diester phosphodiesterase